MNEVMNYKLLMGTDLDGYVRKLLPILVPNDLPQGSIRLLVSQLTDMYALFSQGFQRNANDPFTKLIEQKDLARDNRFSSLKNYIKSFITSDVVEEVAAAERLLALIRKYGWTAEYYNYSQESTAINGLLGEMNGTFLADITLLNATAYKAKLEIAQSEFETVQNQQVANHSVDIPTLTAYRKPMIDLIKMMIQAIDTEIKLAPTDALKAMRSKIDGLIIDTMAIVKARDTRRKNQKEEAPVAAAQL